MEASARNTVFLIFLAFLAVIVQSVRDKDEDAIMNTCLAENNITKDEYDTWVNETSVETDKTESDRNYICFYHCIASESDILDDSGYFDVDKMIEYGDLTADDREAGYKCKELHDKQIDYCEYALNMYSCLSEYIDSSEDEDAVVNTCLAENNITKDEFDTWVNETSVETDETESDRNFKCFYHCIASESDILDDSGYFNVDKMIEYGDLTADDREAGYKCKELHDKQIDYCEYAFNMYSCLAEYVDSSENSK